MNNQTPDDRSPGPDRDRDALDRLEESLSDTWDSPDATVDRRLRTLIGPVTPLHAPAYGFERVALRARRRRHRNAFLTAAAGVTAVGLIAGGVIAGTQLTSRSIETAGCETVGRGQAQMALAAWTGGAERVTDNPNSVPADAAAVNGAGSSPASGVERGVMERKYEWAIGGVLTAAALSAGIIAGCSSSGTNKGPSADATESTSPSSSASTAIGQVTLPSATASAATAAPSPSATLPLCVSTDLSPTVSVVAGSQGAGHESLNVRLTNNSGHTCTVYGFPGLQLQDTNSAGQATNVTRDFAVKPATLTVPNGKSVATTVRFDFDIPAKDEPQTGNCEGPSVYLGIIPPEEKRQLSAMIAGGPVTVCNHGALDVLPFVLGTTGANQ